MEGVRNQALHGLGPSIPEVSFDQFKAAVLPCVDNAKLKQVYYALKDGELSDEGWLGFKFNKAKLQQVPVQGQAEQNGQGQGELKKVVNNSDTDDNISKLVGNINHLMGSDPTHRFAYGLTIEHTDTRFWFCSRSHIFVTESLDLQKNVKDVIYFVMALGSASKEQLGFDPTVRRVQQGSGSKAETRYRFTINGIEYETLEAISTYKANFLLGRANRVFKVQRVVNRAPSGSD
uniref:Fungal-type protein kinase domain-containing protein n=1 Tax=Moniliophthora roreri TaxID=221103 RepID=A0A0W0GEN0_MONRR